MADGQVEGRCFCGAVRFAFSGAPNWVAHCHCESCRRITSSPVTTWISVPRPVFRFTVGLPRYFDSSGRARRGFCEACGSPLTYEYDGLPDEVHIYAASLDDPNSALVAPDRHVFVAEQLRWFEVHDDLPRYAATSSGSARPVRVGPKNDLCPTL